MAEIRYRFPHQILVAFNSIYISGLYDLDPDGLHTKLPSYFIANARASMPLAEHSEVYVSVSNLGDKDYMQRLGNPREGQAFILGLNLRY